MLKHQYPSCYDVLIRTTLTIDPDVAQILKRRMAQTKLTFKQTVNDALRAGLARTATPPRFPRFRVDPHPCAFFPGIDQDRMNQLAGQLEADAVRKKLSR
jgi:hypothetical protein